MKAVGCLIKFQDKILLLKRQDKEDKHESNTWGLVGGNLEKNENSREAIVREAKEEVGIDLSKSNSLNFVQNFNLDYDDLDQSIEFDLFQAEYREKPDIFLSEEHEEFKWFDPEEAYKRDDLMKGLYIILEEVYNLN